VIPLKPRAPSYGVDKPIKDLAQPSARDDAFRRGMALGLTLNTQEEAAQKTQYKLLLDELVELGATDVQLKVEWSQVDTRSIEITPHETRTIDDEILRWVIDQATDRKLRVFLQPTLDLDELTLGGRSTLAPEDWDRWWWSYQRFILHYARIAQGHNAAMLSIGSELGSTEVQGDRWRELIALVRKSYHGQLTYSASIAHFEAVSFWDAVDVMGISGYQELSKQAQPSDAELDKSLGELATRVRNFSTKHERRYLFTELGFPALAHAAQRPRDERPGAVDLLMQLRCYRALYRVLEADPRLEGLYAVSWSLPSGPADVSSSLRGKPAAEVLRHWYRGSRAATVTAAPAH
jgi:hypothetical protein